MHNINLMLSLFQGELWQLGWHCCIRHRPPFDESNKNVHKVLDFSKQVNISCLNKYISL